MTENTTQEAECLSHLTAELGTFSEGFKMFAKVFDSQKYGQILMKADADEQGKPEIRFYFEKKVGDDFVICYVAMPSRKDLRDKFFDEVDLDFAEDIIKD